MIETVPSSVQCPADYTIYRNGRKDIDIVCANEGVEFSERRHGQTALLSGVLDREDGLFGVYFEVQREI